MKRILCIRLPEEAIRRLTLMRPELKGQLQIENCKLKIANSTTHYPLSTIHSSSDPLADRRALETLAQWCRRFSPIVGLEDSAAADSLLLDVTGLAQLFGGEAALTEQIIHAFARRRLPVRVAVADTLGAAWATAHFQSSIIHHPSSITILPPGEVLTALRPLPTAALRLPEKAVELLHQLGIDRIGQLEALPREELSSRFGPQLLVRWDQATGRIDEPVPALAQPPKLQADWSAEHPMARREAIEAALEQLIGQVARMLLRLGRGAVRLECRLDCVADGPRPAEPVRVTVGLFRPTASAGHLFSLAQMQLERLRLPGPLSAIHVAATITAPLLDRQQELFSLGHGLPGRHAPDLANLVERLSSRLGRRSVLRVRLVPDAQPELSWRYDPMVGGSCRRTKRGGTAGLSSSVSRRGQPPIELPPRPLRLLPRPVALPVTWGLSQFSRRGLSQFSRSENGTVPFPNEEAVPLQFLSFQFCGRSHRIAQHWGPERIETGWWRGRTVGRDYYQIETTTGSRYWLFRRLRDGKWFLHGTFE